MDHNSFHRFITIESDKAIEQNKNKWKIYTEGEIEVIGNVKWKQQVDKQGYHVCQHSTFFNGSDKISVKFHDNIPIALSPHRHDFFELIYVYQGNITNFVDTNKIVMSSGDMCLLNVNALHEMNPIEGNTIVVNILITKSLFEHAFFCNLSKNDIIFQFFADSLYQKHLERNYMYFQSQNYNDTDYRAMVHKIISEYLQKRPNYGRAIELALSGLFFELTRKYQELQNQESQHEQQGTMVSISEILRYIGENYQTATVASTAEHFGYHPTYLPQLLKKYIGKSFSEIQQTYRLNMAKDYLCLSEFSIEQIVDLIGYSNKSYFYRIFKNSTGISPLEYRKKHRSLK